MTELIVKHFSELSTSELYEILKTRFEIFVTEQECLYQDLDDKDQDAIHVFCWNEAGRVAGCLRVFWKDHDVIDKLSVVITLVLAFVFLHEEFTAKSLIGCVLIGAGTLIMVI